MINLENIFKNYFKADNTSDKNLERFARIHLSHIQNAEYAEQLKDIAEKTEKLCDAFIEGRSTKVQQSANKKASTLRVNLIMKAFKASISQHEGTIRSKFDSNSATYIMFFPSGMKEYHHANKNRIDLLMERFLSVSEKHEEVLGAEFVALFRKYRDDYKEARTAQLDKKALISNAITDTAESRRALEIQLLRNIFYIGYLFADDPRKCLMFFDQSTIRRAIRKDKDGKGQLVGIVTCGDKALVRVKIKVLDRKVAACHTDSEGKYRSRKVKIGLVRVLFSKAGYVSQELEVEVMDAGMTEVHVELKRIESTK